MSRFYYFKKDNKKEIKKIDRDNIAKDICDKARSWEAELAELRTDYNKIKEDIFPDYRSGEDTIKLVPALYEQRQTYKANIYKSTYQNYDGMVDIEGVDEQSHNRSAIYKASLVYDFDRIKLKATLDEILDDWTDKGEGCAILHWSQTVDKKRNISIEEGDIDELGEPTFSVVTNLEDVVSDEGVDVKRIDPLNFFYDKNMRRNWDSCGKIVRTFVPLQYILANEDYKLTPNEIKELKDLINDRSNDSVSDYSEDSVNIGTKIIGQTVEVLEYYGDYLIPDKGDVARNVVIVIVAGRFLAQLDENEYPVCPIVYGTYMDRPNSLRGQLPLKPVIALNILANKLADLEIDIFTLVANPPIISPKGAVNNSRTLRAGEVFEFNPDMAGGFMPKPMDFSAGLKGFDFIPFFKQQMESATGMSQYLQGNTGGSVRTASESTYINAGATTRLSRESYLFSHKIILPIIESMAKIKREYEQGEKTIPFKKDGVLQFTQINDEIRNGKYKFILGDSQTSTEREQYVKKIFDLLQAPVFQTIVSNPQFPAVDFMKWVLNEVNFRQIDTLLSSLGIRETIKQYGNSIGIKPENMDGYVNDMMGGMQEAIPDISEALTSQEEIGNEQQPIQ